MGFGMLLIGGAVAHRTTSAKSGAARPRTSYTGNTKLYKLFFKHY